MKIDKLSRPWQSNEAHRHNERTGDRSYYQTPEWKRIRNAFLQANPWCIDCAAEGNKVKATVADHDLQRIMGGSDDFSNLRPRCQHHHDSKSAQERNKMYKK